jgi:hypothetical protein
MELKKSMEAPGTFENRNLNPTKVVNFITIKHRIIQTGFLKNTQKNLNLSSNKHNLKQYSKT